MNSITVELPLPPAALSPNRRSHWRAKAAATKKLRREAGISAQASIHSIPYPNEMPWPAATCQVVWKYTHQPDEDNVIAWLKAAFDGLADAGVIENDRNLRQLPPRLVKVGIGQTGVDLIIERVDATCCPMCKRPLNRI